MPAKWAKKKRAELLTIFDRFEPTLRAFWAVLGPFRVIFGHFLAFFFCSDAVNTLRWRDMWQPICIPYIKDTKSKDMKAYKKYDQTQKHDFRPQTFFVFIEETYPIAELVHPFIACRSLCGGDYFVDTFDLLAAVLGKEWQHRNEAAFEVVLDKLVHRRVAHDLEESVINGK